MVPHVQPAQGPRLWEAPKYIYRHIVVLKKPTGRRGRLGVVARGRLDRSGHRAVGASSELGAWASGPLGKLPRATSASGPVGQVRRSSIGSGAQRSIDRIDQPM